MFRSLGPYELEFAMQTPVTLTALSRVTGLEGLNDLLGNLAFRAGWNKHEPSLWPEPRTHFQAANWTWDHARAALNSAGRLINTELADRRNLFMVNPCEGNFYATLRTLVSAYQMLLPGERARSHRHTPNALRLVLDVPQNCYTIVDGIRIDMVPGDVLLTPGWSWHGHGNDGDRPAYWIDFLDVPLVQLLEPMFFEPWPAGFQDPTQSTRNSAFVFPWANTVQSLDAAKPDEYGRNRVELGSPALPTLALHMERILPGQKSESMQSTASQIFAVASGSGKTIIEDNEFQWSTGDVIAIPSWHRFWSSADTEAVLFSVSDQPVLEKLGFLRTA
jgi:gentisate 1,2-dioxygenase